MKKTSLYIVNFALCIIFASCSFIEQYIKERESEGVIASIGDKKLYLEDIENIVPERTTSADSATMVDAYIRRWATDILILQNAERNISNQSEIDKMVENYRRTLTIHFYKQEMVNEKVKLPTDEETELFYENNKQLFTLEQPIAKGAIMIVPNNVKTDKIQRKFKDLNNIADIEKYALQYAKDYQLFTEYWRPIDEIIDTEKSNIKMNKSGYYEERDSLNTTFINIVEFIPQGEVAPIEMIIEEARTMLYNQHKMEYLNNFNNDIYDYAVKHNQIKLN